MKIFENDLDFSQRGFIRKQLEAFYQSRFPNIQYLLRTDDRPQLQANEIDVILILENGETVRIEEKFDRYPETRNFAIELLSDRDRNVPGWAYTSKSDYISYAFIDKEGRLAYSPYLLSTKRLRQWLHENRHLQHRPVPVKNKAWITVVALVPIQVLLKELEEM